MHVSLLNERLEAGQGAATSVQPSPVLVPPVTPSVQSFKVDYSIDIMGRSGTLYGSKAGKPAPPSDIKPAEALRSSKGNCDAARPSPSAGGFRPPPIAIPSSQPRVAVFESEGGKFLERIMGGGGGTNTPARTPAHMFLLSPHAVRFLQARTPAHRPS
jgi:hypothetical protein